MARPSGPFPSRKRASGGLRLICRHTPATLPLRSRGIHVRGSTVLPAGNKANQLLGPEENLFPFLPCSRTKQALLAKSGNLAPLRALVVVATLQTLYCTGRAISCHSEAFPGNNPSEISKPWKNVYNFEASACWFTLPTTQLESDRSQVGKFLARGL